VRISMWSDSYYPYVSGVTRSIATVRETLIAMGHDVSLFCPAYPGASPEPGVYRFPSLRAPTNKRYYVALPFCLGLESRVKGLSPDVVHIHSPFNLGKLGFRMGKRLGWPVVFTYHTMYNMYSHYVPLFGERVSGIVEGLALKVAGECDFVITPSQAVKDYLLRKGLRSNIAAIPHGIDLTQFQEGNPDSARKTYGLPRGIPVIVTSGRLGKEKNLETLLRAYALSLKEVDSVLLVVGDGPLKEPLRKLAEDLGAGKRVVFTGQVAPDSMPDIYAAGSLFLFTSLTDTQGVVIVEAKAAGLPAVAVGALGVKDMIRDGVDGFLCDDHPGEIAERIVFLLKNPSEMESFRKNAKRLAQSFSKENQTRKLLEVYRSVLGGRIPAPSTDVADTDPAR